MAATEIPPGHFIQLGTFLSKEPIQLQPVSQQRTSTPTVLIRILFITALDSSLISPEEPSGDSIRLQCYLNKANTP